MIVKMEQRIDELCDLAASEHDYTKLRSVIEQLLECIDARQRQREEAKKISFPGGGQNKTILQRLWSNQEGQDIAEYGVIFAVILVLVVGTFDW